MIGVTEIIIESAIFWALATVSMATGSAVVWSSTIVGRINDTGKSPMVGEFAMAREPLVVMRSF